MLESMKKPLERRAWYNYPNPSQPNSHTGGNLPSPRACGRVLDDGTAELYKFERNNFDHLTKYPDPRSALKFSTTPQTSSSFLKSASRPAPASNFSPRLAGVPNTSGWPRSAELTVGLGEAAELARKHLPAYGKNVRPLRDALEESKILRGGL